jgi:hypothetical protein
MEYEGTLAFEQKCQGSNSHGAQLFSQRIAAALIPLPSSARALSDFEGGMNMVLARVLRTMAMAVIVAT